jgi:6-phosphofructokinase 1
MNAAVRAIVRVALAKGLSVMGIERGYLGLLEDQVQEMNARSVGGIIQRGGTVLGTARSLEFITPEGRARGIATLKKHGIEGLAVIGGEGSLRGALALHQEGICVVGVPATIDNDIGGTDMAIGVDTALNTALDAVDRIKDTASAHNRAFIIEVMGRHSGYLALAVGLAVGAELVLIPEVETDPSVVLEELHRVYAHGKPHFIVVVAEGARYHGSDLYNYIMERSRDGQRYEVRLSVLGHVQRGGSPSAFDRLLASRLGAVAVNELVDGRSGRMVGLAGRDIISVELDVALSTTRQLDRRLFNLAGILAGWEAGANSF